MMKIKYPESLTVPQTFRCTKTEAQILKKLVEREKRKNKEVTKSLLIRHLIQAAWEESSL